MFVARIRSTRRYSLQIVLVTLLLAINSAARPQQETPQPLLPVFEFHSGFWINLHHFLYQQARARRPPFEAMRQPSPADAEAREPVSPKTNATAELAREEQQAWTAALEYYAQDLAERDLLFNSDMVNIKNRLAELEACADLSGRAAPECASGLRPDLVAALERAARIYRAHWWTEQDRGNRAWIAAVSPMVRQYGAKLARDLAVTYQENWPPGRLRVDVVCYAGAVGAYTTLDPVRLSISSLDPRNQGPAALEILFHEASHALAGGVRDAIIRECRRRGKPIPRDLWHALIFYTTGEIVKRALSVPAEQASGATESAATRASSRYTPYAYRYGLYARGWSNYQRLLERYWQPYLDAKADFDAAVARMVSAL